MLLGLIITWKWIPGQEHGQDGNIKTLEEWEVGRPTPNGFAQTRMAKLVERAWKFLARVADRLYLFADRLAGGDVKEMREQAKRDEEEMREMERLNM